MSLQEKKEGRNSDVLKYLSTQIDYNCVEYAKKKLTDDDYISIIDGIKVLDINILKDNKCYTIKKSSIFKFEDYYYEKLVSIMDKITGE